MSENQTTVSTNDPQTFFLKTGLYELQAIPLPLVYDIVYCEDTLDEFCIHCNRHSTFQPIRNYPDANIIRAARDNHPHLANDTTKAKALEGTIYARNNFFEKRFQCARDRSHELVFFILVELDQTQKIGQIPSFADLCSYDIAQYAKILTNDNFTEFKRAIGLFAHGIGVGSFVYLRRIIEVLVEEAHQKAKDEEGWSEDDYASKRFGEKIELLSHHLPTFLSENTKIYSILSKGIHELTEKECLAIFPLAKSFIELILDEKIAQKVKAEKLKSTMTQLSVVAGSLK